MSSHIRRSSISLAMLALASLCSGESSQSKEKGYRVTFLSGHHTISVTYSSANEKPKSNEFVGCRDITIGYPDTWELVGVQAFGKEGHCYDLIHKLRDGTYKICRLDLRSFQDTSRSGANIELRFVDDIGDISFIPLSKVK